MKLTDTIENLENIDDELIIFIENEDDYNSCIILSSAEEQDGGKKHENGKTYHYLLEVFLAKQFIEDWKQTLDYVPTATDIAIRLHSYAKNDA